MFIPHTQSERDEMLRVIGVKNIEDLFHDVPAAYRFPRLNLPPALTEMEIMDVLQDLSATNETHRDLISFLGAGAYNHYIPSVVDSVIRRGEFLTAYTPYQPEVSQGTLQAVFEYQSLICSLTGMDVSNASHYDGATAAAEAGILAYHNFRGKRTKIITSPSINPQYNAVINTYLCGYEGTSIQGSDLDPFTTPDQLASLLDLDTSMVFVQYPDFFGRIFDYTKLAEKVHEVGALLTIIVNPMALGILKTPAEMGADVVVGEGQPLGIPLSYGGPYLGIFATKKDYVRKLSGRLVGETVDAEGRRGYVLTLTAREQHIRREKATSNICTNQGLLALAATVYMSAIGKHGLKQVAELCYHKAHYAAEEIASIPGFKVVTPEPFFHEFVVECPMPASEMLDLLLENDVIGGYNLSLDYPTLKNHILIAVTEMNSRDQIDTMCDLLKEVTNA